MKYIQRYTRYLLILILSIPITASAQDGDGQAGTRSPFSEFGFGARAMGLGNTFTALADDPTAVFWNPAGLDYIYQQSLTFFHASLYMGTNYDFLGYAYPTLDIGTFALGIARMGVDDIVNTDADFNVYDNFSFESYRGYLSYGLRIPWDLSVGASLKIERSGFSYTKQYNEDANAIGVGMDLGFLYRPNFSTDALLRDWSVGLDIQNLFSPQIKHADESDVLPLDLRFGLMRTIYISGGSDLRLLVDMAKASESDMRFNFGGEYAFQKIGKARIGYNNLTGLQFGIGIEYSMFQLDYAYGNPSTGGALDPVHRISLTINFGMNRDEMFAIVQELKRQEEERIIEEIRQADKKKFVTEHLAKADTFFTEGKYLDAIVEYQQVIGADPFHQRAKIMLDSSNVLLDSEINAQQSAAVAAALDKNRAEADQKFIEEHFEKGRLYLDKKQYTDALIEFNLVLERDRNYQPAISAIQTTRRRMGEDVSSMVRRARSEFEQQNYSEALRLLSDASLLSHDNPQVKKEVDTLVERVKLQENIQKGLMLYDIGQYEDALKIFEDVLSEDPTNQFIQQYYTRSKIEAMAETEPMDPETERKYLEGIDKFLVGKYQEAINIWEDILKDHPYNKKVLEAVSGAKERLKRRESE
jgi:tetratricopeptide (TPR) repeat protein